MGEELGAYWEAFGSTGGYWVFGGLYIALGCTGMLKTILGDRGRVLGCYRKHWERSRRLQRAAGGTGRVPEGPQTAARGSTLRHTRLWVWPARDGA